MAVVALFGASNLLHTYCVLLCLIRITSPTRQWCGILLGVARPKSLYSGMITVLLFRLEGFCKVPGSPAVVFEPNPHRLITRLSFISHNRKICRKPQDHSKIHYIV